MSCFKLLAVSLILSPVFASAQQASDTIITVNGVSISRGTIVSRLWQEHAVDTVDVLVKEELVRQAFKKEKIKSNKKEIDKRFKALIERFPSEEAFKESLAKRNVTEQTIRDTISQQVMREDLIKKVKGIKITSKEVKDFFDRNKDSLAKKESIHLFHLLVKTEQKADSLHLALKAGADFSVLAKEASVDQATKARGGDMGYITKGVIAPDMETVAWSLKKGEISKVLKTNLGFHILYVKDRQKPEKADFKKIRKGLRAAMLADKITKAWPKYLNELRAEAAIKTPQTK